MLLDENGVWFVFEELFPWMDTADYTVEQECREVVKEIVGEIKMEKLRDQLRDKYGR